MSLPLPSVTQHITPVSSAEADIGVHLPLAEGSDLTRCSPRCSHSLLQCLEGGEGRPGVAHGRAHTGGRLPGRPRAALRKDPRARHGSAACGWGVAEHGRTGILGTNPGSAPSQLSPLLLLPQAWQKDPER